MVGSSNGKPDAHKPVPARPDCFHHTRKTSGGERGPDGVMRMTSTGEGLTMLARLKAECSAIIPTCVGRMTAAMRPSLAPPDSPHVCGVDRHIGYAMS